MTEAAWLLLGLAAMFAAADWVAVAYSNQRARWVTKPAAMAALVGVALTLHPAVESERAIFAGALFLCLAGDVLLLPEGSAWFLAGLVAFLAGHVAYVDRFLVGGVRQGLLAYSVPAVAIVSLAIGGRIVGVVAC